MGQQNVTEQLKNQAVGQIYDRMFKDTEFKAGQNAAKAASDVATYEAETERMAKAGELDVDKFKARTEALKAKVEGLKAHAIATNNYAQAEKHQAEINKINKYLETVSKAQESGISDLKDLNIGSLAVLNLKPADLIDGSQEADDRKFKSTQNKELRAFILSLEGVSAFKGLKATDKARVADQTVLAEQLMLSNPEVTISQAAQRAQRTMKLQYKLKELQKNNPNIVYGEDEETAVRGFYDKTTGELIEGI